MGPENAPSRPKFHWDLRNPPWTDGRGSQEQYYNAVALWKQFHDQLPEGNSNKIPARLQGLILQSQLFDRALDLVKKVNKEDIESEEGALKIASAIHKKDVLSIVTDTFQRFQDVLRTRQGDSEPFKSFESRFDAQVCKLNAACIGSELPQALVSFLLLANSKIDTAQRVSILSAATPFGASTEGKEAKEILSMISYDEVASILRACDDPKNSSSGPYRSVDYMRAHSAIGPRLPFRSRNKKKTRLTPQQLADLKSKSTCNRCQKKGHWSTDYDKCELYKKDRPSSVPSNPTTNRGGTERARSSVHVAKEGTLQFNMAFLSNHQGEKIAIGPLVDDAAPYSGIGMVELRAISKGLLDSWNGELEPLPEPIKARPYWQYGSGSHASSPRRLLGSIVFTARSDSGKPIRIRHLVIKGASQWVIGKNVTRHSIINHMDGNFLEFRALDGTRDRMTMIDDEDHSFLPATVFNQCDVGLEGYKIVAALCSAFSTSITWGDRKRILDKVHKHTCGHSSFEDIKLLMQRNGLWTEECNKYLSHLLDTCKPCSVVKASSGSRKVSLSSLSRGFNEVVCVDHFFPDGKDVFHVMDSSTRYSNGALVSSTSLENAISVFDAHWMSEFWPPDTVQADQAFNKGEFLDYLKIYDVRLRPIPPRRHSKNVIESKHRILRDIYLRLKSESPNQDPRVLISRMFRISNDLYGNNIASAHELAKGYTRPIVHTYPHFLPQEIKQAQHELQARRKLNLILSSKSISEAPVHVGDLIEVYIKREHQKRGTWSTPLPVLSYDPDSRTVTVPGAYGRQRKAAIEDIRHAISDNNEFAIAVQSAIDELENDIENSLQSFQDDGPSNRIIEVPHDEGNGNMDDPLDNTQVQSTSSDINDAPSASAANESDNLDAVTYIPEVPSTYDPEDGSTSRWAHPAAPSRHAMELRSTIPTNDDSDNGVTGHNIELLPGTELTSAEQDALRIYYDRFASKEFLLYHAEGLPSFVTTNSYSSEEQNFLKHCILIHRSKVPSNANIISSHVLYKIKQRDDGSLTCKARIAPHGNEDRDREHLKTDSACCPPFGMRMLFSLCQLYKWHLTKIDVKGAFLQSGSAQRDVYVIPPRECLNRQFIWLLTVATYGLVNANSKWQIHSDQTFFDLGLSNTIFVPQLFFAKHQQQLELVVVKVTDDILVAGNEEVKRVFIHRLAKKYELGTITHLPGTCLFFGLQVTQDENYDIHVNADHKLRKIQPYILSRLRRKQGNDPLNSIEQYHFNSINGSIGFIGVHALPMAAFASSHLQQRRNSASVHDIVIQQALLKKLCTYGSTTTYCSPQKGTFQLSVVVFADAARPSEYGQLGVLSGLLFGNLCKDSVFHTLSWSSSLSKRPTRSIASAEILAAGLAVDEGLLLAAALSSLLSTRIPVIVVVDSKNLYDSLTSSHVPEDRSIRADVQLIRYYFETKQIDKIIWVPGSANLADPLTKKDSPLSHALQLLLYQGYLPFQFDKIMHRNSSPSLG